MGNPYFKSLLDRYRGDKALALAAYNWGMGNVEKNPEKIPRETSDYISRVAGYYREAKA
ncbi:MAG: lytic transglycosylase domain-containing protein [Syntrophales bacterium]|nr:lytic transglycosylase domain-containing protein [Syntrophales bacterium]